MDKKTRSRILGIIHNVLWAYILVIIGLSVTTEKRLPGFLPVMTIWCIAGFRKSYVDYRIEEEEKPQSTENSLQKNAKSAGTKSREKASRILGIIYNVFSAVFVVTVFLHIFSEGEILLTGKIPTILIVSIMIALLLIKTWLNWRIEEAEEAQKK